MPPNKGKGRGKRMQPEPETVTESDVEDIFQPTQDEQFRDTGSQEFSYDSAGNEAADKKQKVQELEPAVEQALCEWFADHPSFYDMSDASYKNRQRKDRLLDQKAKELNFSSDQLATWWKSQRTMYGRLHKKKSGQASTRMTERQKWNQKNFSFLKSHIAVRTVTKQLGKVPCPEPGENDDDGSPSDTDSVAPLTSAETVQPGTSSDVTSRPSVAPKKKRQQTTAVDDALLKLVEQASGTQRFSQRVDEVLLSSRNPRIAFSQWIAAETEFLSDQMFRQFQKEVFATVRSYRDMAAQPQQPQVMTLPPVMLQHTSTPTIYHPPRTASAPTPVTVGWQLPTQMTTHLATQDWSQAPAYQQQRGQVSTPQQLPTGLSSRNLSGMSGLQFSPLSSDSTVFGTAPVTTTESRTYDIGAQVVRSTDILRGDAHSD